VKSAIFEPQFSGGSDSNPFLRHQPKVLSDGEWKNMPKYLVEIILIVSARDLDEARRVADYIIDIPIPDKEIENKIETLRCEEIVQIPNQKPR
jgi:hypothetical protein